MLANPGAVPDGALPLAIAQAAKGEISQYKAAMSWMVEIIDVKKIPLCACYRQIKPPGAHHCSRCRRCVVETDHHCPWANNCVGFGNHKFYLLFNFYALLMTLYGLALIATCVTMCMTTEYDPPDKKSSVLFTSTADASYAYFLCRRCPNFSIFRVASMIAGGVLFGAFTANILWDQYSVVTTGVTQIERLKGNTKIRPGIHEVFGSTSDEFALDWLLPVAIWLPQSIKSQVRGYVSEEELVFTEDGDASESDALFSPPDLFAVRTGAMTLVAAKKAMAETWDSGWSIEKYVDVTPQSAQAAYRYAQRE